jgi:hypothetical protein
VHVIDVILVVTEHLPHSHGADHVVHQLHFVDYAIL